MCIRDSLTPEKIAVINKDGERIWGMKETSEVIMHSMAYDICEANGWDAVSYTHLDVYKRQA